MLRRIAHAAGVPGDVLAAQRQAPAEVRYRTAIYKIVTDLAGHTPVSQVCASWPPP